MQTVIYCGLTFGALLWGAITDYKKREIPNAVPVIILLAGFLAPLSLVQHIIGLVLPLIVYFILEKTKHKTIGGGDFKLMGAFGFNAGIVALIIVLLLASILALIFSKDKKRVPLCTYTFTGYVIFVAAFYGLSYCGIFA